MPAAKVPVQYIASKTSINDSTYGTGRWDQGENRIKLLDPALAAKLFKHVDVWDQVPADEALDHQAAVNEVAVTKPRVELEHESDTQDLRDRVSKMGRDDVIAYAQTHYQLKIKGGQSAEATRAELIRHIDLAGAQ
ncbi:MAG: hypothetical protein EOO66_12275 [Methylobacterium sp.]|nr:MAG: hypothetical protein EOO66_12275 [Methylobacterium sp.]